MKRTKLTIMKTNQLIILNRNLRRLKPRKKRFLLRMIHKKTIVKR